MSRARTSRILEPEQPAARLRDCEWPDCPHGGDFRAPRARDALRDYRWFCLEHVRRYNSSWDYYAGMTGDDIERHIRADSTWRRPSWPMGGRPKRKGGASAWDEINDPFGLFEGPDSVVRPKPVPENAGVGLTAAQRKAMAVLEMVPPLTLPALRERYRALVKRHHPDANGGSKRAEERLKAVNLAYSSLKQSLTGRSP